MKLSEQYATAMKAGIHSTCERIERAQGLDGFPPELVSIGLLALEDGRDPYSAIWARMNGGAARADAAAQGGSNG